MRARELFLQGGIFTISSLTLLLLLSVAAHFPAGRVFFAVAVSLICLIAEGFALFKATQLLWRWSNRAALATMRIWFPGQLDQDLLTENKN